MKTAVIIGISNYARYHLFMAMEQALRRQLRLVAAVVVNQQEEAFLCQRLHSLGCEIFSDTESMWVRWEGHVDLCFIPTGIHLHAPMTLRALSAGASVLVEKPLTATVAEALAIMRAEEQTGRFVAVGFQDLYTEPTWTIKKRLLDGALGGIQAITITGLWPRHAGYYLRNEWAGRLKQNGQWVLDSPIHNAFAHFLNLGLFWAGSSLASSASVRTVESELYRVQSIENFDTCCIRATVQEGAQLRIYVTHSCVEDRVPRMTIEGSRGRLTWIQESHYEMTDRDGRRERWPIPGKIETKLMMADAVMARFTDPFARICSTSIAIEHLRLVEAAHKASGIIEIPAEFIHQRTAPSGNWREIVGIETVIDEASRHGLLWSELNNVPWARPAGSLTLT